MVKVKWESGQENMHEAAAQTAISLGVPDVKHFPTIYTSKRQYDKIWPPTRKLWPSTSIPLIDDERNIKYSSNRSVFIIITRLSNDQPSL